MCLYCTKTQPVQVVLPQFYPTEAMSQPPCFDIEYWWRYRPFLSKQSQLIKIKSHHYCVTLLNAISYEKLSQWHHFQTHHPPFILTIHIICLYLSSNRWGLCCWNPPSSCRHFFIEVFFWYRSHIFYTRYFSFLNWTWNFLLWKIAVVDKKKNYLKVQYQRLDFHPYWTFMERI